MSCKNFFLRPQAGNFVRLFAGRLRLNPARRHNSFCGYKFNHKNWFVEGFTNRSATDNFFQCGKNDQSIHTSRNSAEKSSKPRYIFLLSKTAGIFSFSRSYFHRYISLKILQTKLFNKSSTSKNKERFLFMFSLESWYLLWQKFNCKADPWGNIIC